MATHRIDLKSKLKEDARKRGAVAFGVAPVHEVDALEPIKIGWPAGHYTKKLGDYMPTARSVVVFGIPSLDDADELQISRGEGNYEWPGYTRLGLIARDLIWVLRRSGFSASFVYEMVSFKYVAKLAGIGNFGKNTLIINKKHGPWLRFGMVVTDAPLLPDQPFDDDLCGRCDRCVRACPMRALSPHGLDRDRCLVAAAELREVPPSLKRAFAKYSPMLTPNARVMCTECQKACRYTSAKRRRSSAQA